MDTLTEWYNNPINIKRLSTWLRKYIRVNGSFRTQDDVDATIENIIQTSFFNLYRKGPGYIEDYTHYASIDTVIFKAAMMLAISETRPKIRQNTISLEDFEQFDNSIVDPRYHLNMAPSPDVTAENNELNKILYTEINKLKDIYKKSILLWMQRYSYKKISGILNVPEGTAKSRVGRAMKMLRKEELIKKYYEIYSKQ